MTRRSIVTLAAGVLAGAAIVGVPTFALADSDSGGGTSGSDMAAVMDDPAFVDRMKTLMSEMMSDPELQEQMRSMMGDMGDMSGEGMDMGDMGGMGGDAGEAPGTP
jgi:long-subunit fatty acid transport protein